MILLCSQLRITFTINENSYTTICNVICNILTIYILIKWIKGIFSNSYLFNHVGTTIIQLNHDKQLEINNQNARFYFTEERDCYIDVTDMFKNKYFEKLITTISKFKKLIKEKEHYIPIEQPLIALNDRTYKETLEPFIPFHSRDEKTKKVITNEYIIQFDDKSKVFQTILNEIINEIINYTRPEILEFYTKFINITKDKNIKLEALAKVLSTCTFKQNYESQDYSKFASCNYFMALFKHRSWILNIDNNDSNIDKNPESINIEQKSEIIEQSSEIILPEPQNKIEEKPEIISEPKDEIEQNFDIPSELQFTTAKREQKTEVILPKPQKEIEQKTEIMPSKPQNEIEQKPAIILSEPKTDNYHLNKCLLQICNNLTIYMTLIKCSTNESMNPLNTINNNAQNQLYTLEITR